MTVTSETKKPIKRRTAAERVADLQAEIRRVEEREAARELKSDPSVQEAARLVRVLNKSAVVAEEAKDEALATALSAAREAVGGYLKGRGLAVPQRRAKQAKAAAKAG